MKRKLKTVELTRIFGLLNNARLVKLSAADRLKVWKITRAIKPFASKYEEESRDAAAKLVPTSDFEERLQKARIMEHAGQKTEDPLPMTWPEYDRFISELNNYNNLVDEALRPLGDAEVEIDIETLGEDGFGDLLASNDWTTGQILLLGETIVG